ncbi:ubiquitin hydrolase [Trypanosoma rangeli SC58]|uniref:Ubiquitin hydrolase n=1 Tax=Trypanosoma rangeli SC58 TaxID=429131 RepID=A0A061J7B2_TRYRA|nr:ubiquitin hydrolase [Trypanosoma rangeli SC58]
MGERDLNTDVKPLSGEVPTQVKSDGLVTDAFTPSDAEKVHAQNGIQDFWFSSKMPVVNSTYESSPAVETFSSPLVPITPVEVYVREVLREMADLLEDGDLVGSIFKARDELVPFKDGVAVFEVPWFATMRDHALRAMKAARARVQQSFEEQFSLSDGDADIDVGLARRLFVPQLGETTGKVLHRYYSKLYFYRRRFPHEMHVIFDQLNERVTQTLLATQAECSQQASASSLVELEGILLHDFELWISFILPYFKYALSSGMPMQLLWQETAVICKEEVAFQVYTTATRVNLQSKGNHIGRGALFSVKWMQKLLQWLCSSKKEDAPPPGPFDTFQLVELSSDHPVKHVVREENSELDIIPEELFELLWRLFGGGPKYLVEGKFKMLRDVKARLKPRRVTLAFVFGEAPSPSVFLERVLHRAEVSEVMRRAMHKLQKTPSSQWGRMDLAEWHAALCIDDGVNICVTHARGAPLEPPQSFSNLSAMSVGEVLEQVQPALSTGTDRKAPALQFKLCLRQRIDNIRLEECGVCGLPNIGNTCYMNSALQCLFNMRAVRHAILSIPLSECGNPLVTREMVCLLRNMWSGVRRVADTLSLKTAFGREVSRFDSYEQQDAMEFIETLLDCMHEETKKITGKCHREVRDSDASIPAPRLSKILWQDFLNNNKSFISELFFFQTSTRLECLTCGAATKIFEKNLSLAATVVTPPKKRMTEVVVLLPMGKRVRVQLLVQCDWNGAVYPADIARELTELLRTEDVVATAARVQAAVLLTATAHDENNISGNMNCDVAGNANDGTEDGVGESRSVLDGHRVIIHGDEGKPLLKKNMIFAAVVPKAVEPEQTCGEAAEKEAPEKDGSDVRKKRDEGQEEVYMWYFIKAIQASFSALHEPFYVERISADVFSTYSRLASHILEQGQELSRRCLKEQRPAGADLSASTPDLLTGELKDVDDGRHFHLLYQAHTYDAKLPITPDGTNLYWGRFGATNPSLSHSGESRVWLEYDDSRLALRDGFRCMIHPSACTARYSSLRGSSVDCNEASNRVTLEECLEATYSPDKLEGDNAIECRKCKGRQDSKMERRPFLLPKCLLISLKRFRVHMEEASKNNTRVKFSKVLDMTPYLDPESPVRDATYTLRGVVTHRGDINYGHYSATALNDSCGKWVLYDDWRTLIVGEAPIKDAFVLFYERVKTEADTAEHATGKTSRL